jgi:hypothetical protein
VFLDPLFQWVTPGRWLGKSCGGIDGAEKKEELNKHTVSAFQHQFKIQNSKFKIESNRQLQWNDMQHCRPPGNPQIIIRLQI